MMAEEIESPNFPRNDYLINTELENVVSNSLGEVEESAIIEATALKETSEKSPDNSIPLDNCLTISGTIKRGKKKDQNVQVVLNMSREELEIIEANITNTKDCSCQGEPDTGIHIFLWSLICLPISILTSLMYSFCLGTITWYNVFSAFSERIKQISCSWNSWLKEFTDFEKGFFGWLCNVLDVPDCCPYEVIILSKIQKSGGRVIARPHDNGDRDKWVHLKDLS